MFFKNSAALLAAKDASISATAQMKSRAKAPRDSTRRRRRFQTDSTGVPDFLREKDFRRSDISFQVNQSLRRLSDNWNPSLHLRSSEGLFASPAFPLRSRFNGLSASLKEDKVTIDSVRITSGTSDLTLKGTVEGLKRGLTHGRSLIRVNADLTSDRLNLNEIIAAFDKGKTEDRPALVEESEPVQVDALAYERQVAVDSLTVEEVPEKIGLFVVPANVIGDVHLNVAQLDYSTTLLQDFQADASMQQRCIRLDGARAMTDMGRFELDAFYSTKTKQDLALGFGLKLRDVTAEKVIEFLLEDKDKNGFPDIIDDGIAEAARIINEVFDEPITQSEYESIRDALADKDQNGFPDIADDTIEEVAKIFNETFGEPPKDESKEVIENGDGTD